jgi:hypothetical protein
MSSKTGRKGYSPACGNEWVRGVCEKPRVKCSDCPNQAFLPFSDQVVLDHLQGRHTIGVYPLLRDETCWFLAADFDKESWLDDVAAFVDTCRTSVSRPQWNVRDQVTAPMSGSFSVHLSPLPVPAAWVVISSPRPWHAAISYP